MRARGGQGDQRCDKQKCQPEFQIPVFLCESSVALCVSVVKSGPSTPTTETQRSTEITQRTILNLKNQNPAAFLLRESDRLATGSFPERRIPTAA